MQMNHKQQIHEWIKAFTPLDTVVDMTAGNGYDTLFLAQHAKHVIAIDIQEDAIIATQERCKKHDNITYQLGSNDLYKFETGVDGLVYNLGYLPGSDKSIITTAHSTVTSLKNALPFVKRFISISCYRKHDCGDHEYHEVKAFVKDHFTNYQVLKYDTELSPVVFLISI